MDVMTKEYTDSDFIKMANGKMPLPEGLSKTKYGSYRVQRQINRNIYAFPTIRNFELALDINSVVSRMAVELKADPTSITSDEVVSLIVDSKLSDMEEITRQNEELKKELQELKYNVQTLFSVVNTIHENQNKSFFRRIFNL